MSRTGRGSPPSILDRGIPSLGRNQMLIRPHASHDTASIRPHLRASCTATWSASPLSSVPGPFAHIRSRGCYKYM